MPRKPRAERVYDAIAPNYSGHRTSSYFSRLQDVPVSAAIYRKVGTDRRGKKALVVGVGDIETHLRQLSHPIDPTGFRLNNITLLDISRSMLDSPVRKSYTWPKRVQGDANKLKQHFKPRSFDLVLAALSDHLDNHSAFFRAAHSVLKPGGVLVVSYPSKQLMHTIRRQLYEIPVNQTRFKAGRRVYKLRSTLHTPTELRKLLERAGFGEVDVEEVKHDKQLDDWLTETVKKGCKLLGKKPHETPIVVVATGRKPANARRKLFIPLIL